MNKLLLTLLTLCLALTMQAQARHGGNDNPFNSVSYRPLPPLCINGQQGVSAAFAGSTGSKLLVAGGCNFRAHRLPTAVTSNSMPTSTNSTCTTPQARWNGTK